MDGLLIIGAGGHGRSVAEAVLLGDNYRLLGFVDDSWPKLKEIWGFPVLGNADALLNGAIGPTLAIVAIGNNAVRERLHKSILAAGFELATVIHPRAMVSPRAAVGAGCAVMAGGVVGTEAMLGEGVIVNSGAVVDHHCRVSDFGHLGVGACMAGGAILGRGAWLQAAAALGYGVNVAAGAVLAPGTALSADTRGQ